MLVPGVAATMAVLRTGDVDPAAVVALPFALGYAVVAVSAYLLAAIHVLRPLSLFAVVAGATLGLAAFGLAGAGLRGRWRDLRGRVREDRWSLGVGIAVMVAVAAVFLTFSPYLNLHHASPFRYWADGLELADAGRIPSSVLQWGRIYPSTVSKVTLNAFNGGMSFALGRNPIRALPPLMWLGSVGLALGLWSLGRELGLRRTAPLLPVLLMLNTVVFNPEIAVDLQSYKAELFGRLVATAGTVVAVRAIRRREGWGDVTVAGVLFGVGASTHLIPVIVGLIVVGSYAAARLALDRRFVDIAVRTAAVGGVAVVLAVGILVASGGDVGFGGAGGDRVYHELGTPYDPTRYFSSANLAVSSFPPPRAFYYSPGFVFDTDVAESLGVAHAPRAVGLLLVAALVGLGALVFVRFPPDLRPLGVIAVGLAGALLGAALYFSWRYDVWILARFGMRRMFDYDSIPVVLLILAVLEMALGVMAGRNLRLGRWAAAATVGVVGALLIPRSLPDPSLAVSGRAALPALSWIRANVPCDARILANQRTAGTFEATTGRAGILEGMAPYLRPPVLLDVVRLTQRAKSFFNDPSAREGFLQAQGVDYVVSIDGVPFGAAGANLRGSNSRLEADPSLRLVYRQGGVTIFEVRTRGAPGVPRPVARPGYRCLQDPLTASSPA